MAHDNCDHDDLPTTLEKTLHDLEDICEANLCNTVSAPFEVVCAATGYKATTSNANDSFKAIVAATVIPAAIMLVAA